MLTLSLLRHAKSSWKNPSLADFDRSLSSRGEVAAPVMGKAIAEHGLVPDLVLCSSSRRTRETLELVLPSLEPKPEIRFVEALYHAEPDVILGLLHGEPPQAKHIMVIGHNPGFHAFAYEAVGSGPLLARDRLAVKLPTCGLVVIRFRQSSWQEIGYGKGELALYLVPSDLGLTPSPIDP
jgi:phosphohistidine phosphatase